jgi:hypothetical protein
MTDSCLQWLAKSQFLMLKSMELAMTLMDSLHYHWTRRLVHLLEAMTGLPVQSDSGSVQMST